LNPFDNDSAFEAAQTQRLLGVAVQDFPLPQGPAGFDELASNAPAFRFTVTERPLSGPKPREFYDVISSVEAHAPDGSVYEAYCGYDDPDVIVPGHAFISTMENRRQRYGTHHGYGYRPQDIFIGKRESGKLKPMLFFRDVGSHTTAPHYLAIDSQGQFHLAVADVNIFQDNRLDLYWVIGNPKSEKWTAAWLIDRRDYTSAAHPWSAALGDGVHLVWGWDDMEGVRSAGSGLFHVEWGPGGFSRKVRVVSGEVYAWGAAIDPQSGRLVIAYAKDRGVYVVSRLKEGNWTRSERLHPGIGYVSGVAIKASEGGAFVIRTNIEEAREWVLSPE
jgi:hypothetical protein